MDSRTRDVLRERARAWALATEAKQDADMGVQIAMNKQTHAAEAVSAARAALLTEAEAAKVQAIRVPVTFVLDRVTVTLECRALSGWALSKGVTL